MTNETDERKGRGAVPNWVKTLAKIIIAGALLWLVLRRFLLSDILSALGKADVSLCLLGYSVILISNVIQGFELGLGVRRLVPDAPFGRLLRVHFVAFFYALIVPTQVTSSVVKWHRIAEGGKYRAQAAAVVIYVRVLNWIAILLWAMPGVLFDEQLVTPALRLGSAAVLGASVLLAAPLWSVKAARAVNALAHRSGRTLRVPAFVGAKVAKVWRCMAILTEMEPWRAWSLIGMALIHHGLTLASYYVLALAVGVHLHISVVLWLTLLLFVLQALPISILGIGVRDATMVGILPSLYGVEPSAALALSFLLLGRQLLLCLVGGAFELQGHLRRYGSSPSDRC